MVVRTFFVRSGCVSLYGSSDSEPCSHSKLRLPLKRPYEACVYVDLNFVMSLCGVPGNVSSV